MAAANLPSSLPLLAPGQGDTSLFSLRQSILTMYSYMVRALNGGLQGVTDGSNAQPGQIGEVISALLTTGLAVGGSPTTLLSMVLSPGDWDVTAELWLQATGSTNPTTLQGAINTVANFPGVPGVGVARYVEGYTSPVVGLVMAALGPARISSAANTTVYLMASSNQTANGYGKLYARRAR
jgi:hypothetical protein